MEYLTGSQRDLPSAYEEPLLNLRTPSPLQTFAPNWPGAQHVNLFVKRDDLIHPVISGNKWRKLKYTLRALPHDSNHIVSFGGGFSNHLHACGFLCNALNLRFTAIVRGDYRKNLTPMLRDLLTWRADIVYVDKKTYRLRNDPHWLSALQLQYPNSTVIPEGGSQIHALRGVADILLEDDAVFDHILAPVGSGATLAGLISSASPDCNITGVAVLKGEAYLESLVTNLLPDSCQHTRWRIEHRFYHGGYGKASDEIRRFCDQTAQDYGIPLEPVYSGKLFFAIKALLSEGHFSPGARIMIVHTGGLQGAREG